MIIDEKEYLKQLHNSLGEAIFAVKLPERTIEYVNRAINKVFGYTSEECIGKQTDILYPSQQDYLNFGEMLEEYLRQNKEVFKTDLELKRKNGEVFPAQITTSFIRKDDRIISVVSVVNDITKRKEAEENFKLIAENINEVFWVGSPDWKKVYYVSPAYENVWGRTCQSLYISPLSWLDGVHAEDQDAVRLAISRKASGESSSPEFPEYRVVHSDGSIKWILARSYPVLDKTGNIRRIAGIAEDITLRKMYEEKLKESQTELEERVKGRTQELQSLVKAMAGRENRMADLKKAIGILQKQLKDAGISPEAGDPLKKM